MRSFKCREELKKSHSIGIKINFAQSKMMADSNQNSNWTNRLSATVSHLNDEDADLLSLTHKNKDHIHLQIPDEIFIENDFYEGNKVA